MALTHLPTLVVEWAPTNTPLETAPTWVDITSYVRHIGGVTIGRGRPTEVAQFQAGRAALTLANLDRRFDPLYAAGTYYGNLTPRKQIRIRATWSAVTYDLFRGHIVGWPQEYPSVGTDAVVQLEAYDALGWLAETFLPADAIYDYANTTIGSLSTFLRQADTGVWKDAKGTANASRLGGTAAPGSSLCVGAASPSVTFDGNVQSGWNTSAVPCVSLAFWVKTTVVGNSSTVWKTMFLPVFGSTTSISVGINDKGQVCARGSDYNPTFYPYVESGSAVNDGNPHWVVITNDRFTQSRIYVDGVDVSTNAASFNSGYWPINYIGVPDDPVADQHFIGSLQDVATWNVVLTAAQVSMLYGLYQNQILESTTARAGRVLDTVGWPSAWRALTASPRGLCWAANYAKQPALTHLQDVGATEQGRLFAGQTNAVTLHTRYSHQETTRSSTSQATFADDASGINYVSIGFDYNDREISNDVTVVAQGVGSATSTDATSVANYGQQSQSITTLLPTLQLAQNMADGLVFWRRNPVIRSRPILVMAGGQPSVWATVLGLEIGDRVTVKITPKGVGAQISQDLIIERIDWHITVDQWDVSFTGSPVPASFFVLGTSTLGTGQLGF